MLVAQFGSGGSIYTMEICKPAHRQDLTSSLVLSAPWASYQEVMIVHTKGINEFRQV